MGIQKLINSSEFSELWTPPIMKCGQRWNLYRTIRIHFPRGNQEVWHPVSKTWMEMAWICSQKCWSMILPNEFLAQWHWIIHILMIWTIRLRRCSFLSISTYQKQIVIFLLLTLSIFCFVFFFLCRKLKLYFIFWFQNCNLKM